MNIPPKSLKVQIAGSGTRMQANLNASSAYADNASTDRPKQTTAASPAAFKHKTAPALRQNGSLASKEDVSADSLPVLQAFQEFIETERRHSRRQVMVVTTFFLLLFVMVSGAAAFFGYVYFSQLNDEIALLRSEVSRAGTSMKVETSEMLASLAQKTELLAENIIDSDALVQIASSQISNTFSNALTAKQAEIDMIRNALIALRRDNMEFKKQLLPTPGSAAETSPLPIMADSGSPAKDQPQSESGPARKTQRIATRIVAPSSEALEIAILAPGASKPMKWRIPISE